MVKKMISIREDQAEWIKENFFNLSKFVQKKLDEIMEGRNARSYGEPSV